MNRLVDEQSSYLRQHADNPVHWWPWCDEAFEEARRRGVPVFLSIGYAACQWCHVMAHESFEDPSIAQRMNRDFVNVKVDREERPDVDAFYLDALQAMGRPAGWPLSVWLDHERRPFFGGTYFPPTYRYGQQPFVAVLESLSSSWSRDPEGQARSAAELVQRMSECEKLRPAARPGRKQIGQAVAELVRHEDEDQGGWGGGAKFPMPPKLELLLTAGVLFGHDQALPCAERALDAMDRGGLHDHVGGGFHRYCVDPEWDVPHFEKMLYDNAQLLRVYAIGARVLDPRFAAPCRGIVRHLVRDLRRTDGTFASSLDADADGVEGASYVWTREEVRDVLGARAQAVIEAYTVREFGNHEGGTVLRRASSEAPGPGLRAALQTMEKARRARVQPGRDHKAVVAWNGLAVSGLAVAGRLLSEAGWVRLARDCAEVLVSWEDRLPRTVGGRHEGVLQDHAWLAEGLLDLHAATLESRWLDQALRVAAAMTEGFEHEGRWYRTRPDSDIALRQLDLDDGAMPSGAGRALEVLRRLEALGWGPAKGLVERSLHTLGERVGGLRGACLASVAARSAVPQVEIVLSGELEALHPLAAVAWPDWRPQAVLAAVGEQDLAAFAGRAPRPDGPRAYVCQDSACSLPARSPESLREALEAL